MRGKVFEQVKHFRRVVVRDKVLVNDGVAERRVSCQGFMPALLRFENEHDAVARLVGFVLCDGQAYVERKAARAGRRVVILACGEPVNMMLV